MAVLIRHGSPRWGAAGEGSGGYGLRRCVIGCYGGALPIAERTAEERGGAAFATEDDDVVAEGEVPVPRNELDGLRSAQRQDP